MDQASASAQPYRVLARTYRPQRLSALIGQEALVRTLTNAMHSGRIAHAFLLSGIRGIGKTTTARIIAKGLNCTGLDGKGGPTPEPCGECPSCRSLVEERPLDVIEMDAATRTGIDDIREIVDAVRYAPASSRYKIYIIDEVHMLSEKAFNGLLKTLEEPPPHAKFIFATTEVRKLPVTVLSRCQRFDLKRVEPAVLEAHLAGIAAKEQISAEPEALALIARAAEGSVRDALSLLDQAIALSDGPVTAATVAGMLGLGDRQRLIGLLAAALNGEAGNALDQFRELFRLGAEPVAVLQDLLEIGHWLSCLKLDRDAATAFATTPEAVAAGKSLADSASLAVLSRAWQVLLKGLDEVRGAPDAASAAEMVLLRLAAMGDLPTPGEVIKRLQQQAPSTPRSAPLSNASGPQAPTTPPAPPPVARIEPLQPRRDSSRDGDPRADRADLGTNERPDTPRQRSQSSFTEPTDFAELVRLLGLHGEPLLASYLREGAHLVSFHRSRLEMRLAPGLPSDIPGRLSDALLTLTGRRWMIGLSKDNGEATLAEQEAANRERMIEAAAEDASVRQVLDAFPGATIVDIREGRRREPAPVTGDGDPEAPEAWPEPRADDDDHTVDPDEQLADAVDDTDDSRMER